MNCDDRDVAVVEVTPSRYPDIPPFHPRRGYAELPAQIRALTSPENGVYEAVRNGFKCLGLDANASGTANWNPLSGVVSSGDTVLIKPNAVWDRNPSGNEKIFASITHASVLRPLIDYAYTALGGKGRIVVADSPLAHSDFDNWIKITGLGEIKVFYAEKLGFLLEIIDMRRLSVPWNFEHDYAPSSLRQIRDRDPLGYTEINLGAESEFSAFDESNCQRLCGADYDRTFTVRQHEKGSHRYLLANTFLSADVVISVPKLKVHSKVGVTLNLKGFVGIQGDKNYLPHYRIGSPCKGGDEYPDSPLVVTLANSFRSWLHAQVLARRSAVGDRIYELLSPFLSRCNRTADRIASFCDTGYIGPVFGGGWSGNGTAWRMALDVVRLAVYASKKGELSNLPQRKFVCLIDGVIGGEGEGPLSPQPKQCGVLLAGFNPLAVDLAATRLMGFDPKKIPLLSEGMDREWLCQWEGGELGVRLRSNIPEFEHLMVESRRYMGFIPPGGWRGVIELD